GVSVSRPEGHAAVGACWERLPQARSYQVEVASDPEFRKPLGTMETAQVTSWSKALGVGRYYVRVRGIDADGIPGEPSVPRPLAVIPCALPPGGTADLEGRTLIVPEGRALSFGDTTGIEMAIDGGGFSRAPQALTMDGGARHEL